MAVCACALEAVGPTHAFALSPSRLPPSESVDARAPKNLLAARLMAHPPPCLRVDLLPLAWDTRNSWYWTWRPRSMTASARECCTLDGPRRQAQGRSKGLFNVKGFYHGLQAMLAMKCGACDTVPLDGAWAGDCG